MTYKKNCWEYNRCGKQPGGNNLTGGQPCPASISTAANGINSGINGGRACWAISGTHCDDEKQGSYSEKLGKCLRCDFFESVRQEEGARFHGSRKIMDFLNKSDEKAA